MAVLQQALAFGPEDPAVLASTAGLATRVDEEQEDVRRLLEGILQDGSSPAAAAAHFVLGTAASTMGDLTLADRHRQAAQAATTDNR
jgi:hypothetical protein